MAVTETGSFERLLLACASVTSVCFSIFIETISFV